jgi:8-amino-7-oxononanoate synthase
MDGDYADLEGLVALRERHTFALMLDEAHATLVTGPR